MLDRRSFLLFAGAGLLAACESAPPARPQFAPISFASLPPLQFGAERVDVVNDYAAPLRPPNVEHNAPVPPAEAMQRWGRERLRANGVGDRVVRCTVQRASIVETPLARSSGVGAMFTTDQVARFDGAMAMTVEIRRPGAPPEASASAEVARSATVSEKATLNDRDVLLHRLVEDMMRELDARLTESVRQYMGRFLLA